MEKNSEKLPYGKRPEVRIRGGVSQEKKNIIQGRYAEQFRGDHYRRDLSLENRELLEKVEYKKGEREKYYINRANELINEVMIACGAIPFDVLEDNIYFVEESFFKEKFKDADQHSSAYYLPGSQDIAVRGNPSDTPVGKMKSVLHEMIHAKEFVSVHAKEEKWGIRRLGMTNVVGGEAGATEIIGKGLNEAVVARLEKSLSRKIFNESDFFDKERRAQERNKNVIRKSEEKFGLSPGDMLIYEVHDGEVEFSAFSYAYPRQVLDYLIRGISLVSDISEAQAEKVLFSAYFSGDLSSWAKIKTSIQKTFGKDAFDVIMKMTPDDESAQEVLTFLQERQPIISPQVKRMEKKNPSPKSHLELLIPNKKQAKQKEDAIPHGFTEEEIIRNEAWHGKKVEAVQTITEAHPKRKGTVHSLDEARARKVVKANEGDSAEEIIELTEVVEEAPEVKKMTPAEIREARESEERQIEAFAQEIYEKRMRGEAAEEIDAILVEKGIKPWTPEAEEFMRKWDWEQAEHAFTKLASNRQEAVLAANEPEPNKRVELQEQQASHVEEKFAAFNINPDGLPQELKEEFETLTYGQRLLLAENLQQLTLGRIQEEAVQKFQDDTKQSRFLGRIWKGVTKKYQIAKHEQNTARDIKQGGLAYHGELLKQLIDGTKRTGLDAIEGKDGMLELQYVEAHPMMTEREKEGAKEFNRIATMYSKVPYEWSLATATADQKKEYERVHAQFEKAKEQILMTEQGLIGDEQALLFVADMENKIRLNQFFNTHPDAEKQLQSIESDSVWSKAISNTVTERGMYFGAGLATRTFATSLLGAVGFPLAAVGMGGWLARRRAAETLRERAKAGRRGTKDTSKEAVATVTADSLAKKLEGLVQKINSEQDSAKREELLASLQVRLEYTQNKLDKGAVDFGSSDRRIANQYGLMDALTVGSSTFVAQEAEQGRGPAQFKEETQGRLERYLQFKDAKTTKAQKDYLRKQMIYGAGLGIAAFSAGYYTKDVLEGAGMHANTGSSDSIMQGYVAKEATGPEMMPAHESITFGAGDERSGVAEAAEYVSPAVGASHEQAPVILSIGKRGPEGAFIDELRKHPEIAERLGIKNVGEEAHAAWVAFAKESLRDPETKQLLGKLGYSQDIDGYGEMMRHIEHGSAILEERDGKLHMRMSNDASYLPARAKRVLTGEAPFVDDAPTRQQIIGDAPVVTPEAAPPFDVDKAFRDAPMDGIVSEPSRVERPTIALGDLMETEFGIDGEEYDAIKGLQVSKLLEQIPSRDEAWAIWRGEVPGKEIDLPHDGIYGAMEFKKHIDLAEHIRGLRPDDTASQGTIDSFMQSEMRGKGFNLSEATTTNESVTPVVDTTSTEVIPTRPQGVDGTSSAEDIPVRQQVIDTQPTSQASVVESVSTGQRAAEAALQIEGLAPERMELLREDVYNSKMPVQKLITHYKVGNIAPEDFMRYYTQKVANVKPSSEMLANIKTTFSHAAGEGTPQQRLMAQRALDLLVKRIQVNK